MATTINGDTGVIFPDASTQSKAVSQATPFAVTASAIAGAELQLPEATANGVNYVAVKAPNTLAANTTFTLPSADGTNGQYLQTNGSGALAFASVPTTTPGGTTGQVQINSAGAFGAVAEGTAGQVLTSAGAGVAPSFATLSTAVQYPQNIQTANYTLVLGDAGKMIFHPASDANIRTYTIPANASVAFPIGTVVLFTVENGGTQVFVACGDTLISSDGTTGTVRVNANRTLTAIKITATKWMANPSFSEAPQTVAVAHSNSPYISAYLWGTNGFGTKFNDPATLPPFAGIGVAFNSLGNAVAVAHGSSPYVTAYPWSTSGFGSKYANPATLPAINSRSVAFTTANNALALALEGSPFITAYGWSGSGFGTKFTDPATLPANLGYGVAFSPSDNAVAIAHAVSPYITAYPWSGAGFGTKFTDPATLPTGGGFSVAFNPAGDAIAVGHNNTPWISVYPWSGSGFGTKFTNPATLPTDAVSGVTFTPSGNTIALGFAASPYISAYPWSGAGFGTKFSDPGTLPTGGGNGIAFNPSGTAVAVAHSGTPFITAYPWSGSGFGTKYTNPTTLPTGTGFGVAFTVNP